MIGERIKMRLNWNDPVGFQAESEIPRSLLRNTLAFLIYDRLEERLYIKCTRTLCWDLEEAQGGYRNEYW